MHADEYRKSHGPALEREARLCLAREGAIGDASLLVEHAVSQVARRGKLTRTGVVIEIDDLGARIAAYQHEVLYALPAALRSSVRESWKADPGSAMRERPHAASLAALHRRQTKRPLYQLLRQDVPKMIRACTPSVHMLHDRFPADALDSDVSVSFDEPGTLVDRKHAFGQLFEDIAALYEADQAWAGVAGTTGSNWAIARVLSFEFDRGTVVLVARGSHISVPQALTDFGIEWQYIDAPTDRLYDREFEAVLPADPVDVGAAIERVGEDGTQLGAVWINSPTYEGLCADIRGIRDVIDNLARGALLIVDEAWGSHFNAHPVLREHAGSTNGADIVASSTHKQAGGLQGTSVIIRPKESRCDPQQLNAAVQALTTTSPSYLLLSSMAWVYEELRHYGPYWTGRLEKIADRLRLLLDYTAGAGALVFADELSQRHGRSLDPLKVTFALTNRPHTVGIQVATELASEDASPRIIAEKAGLNTLQFLVTFQMDRDSSPHGIGPHAKRVVAAVAEETARVIAQFEQRGVRRPALTSDPFSSASSGGSDRRAAATRGLREGQLTPLADCAGRISGERVAAYPPGIPIILEGDRISQAQVDYLLEVCAADGHLAWNGGHDGHLPGDGRPAILTVADPDGTHQAPDSR